MRRATACRLAPRWAALVAAVIAVNSVGPARPAAGSPTPARLESPELATAADGVTAHDLHFWRNGSPYVLRGVNVETHEVLSAEDATRIAGWGFNVIRLRIHWADLEPRPPVQQADGSWSHSYDAEAMAHIKTYVDRAWANGVYTILDNHNCGGCSFFKFPGWTAQAAYNSKKVTYPSTAAGLTSYETDFWSDPLRQQFMTAAMTEVARRFAANPGVLGYEVLNEPQQGSLPATSATTAKVLNIQLQVARGFRQGDPGRVLFFQTRAGYGPGLHKADLSSWQALGNVAFDLHDGFGARWGNGLQMDPNSPDYLENLPLLNNNITIADVPPYIGNTVVQARILQDRLGSLRRWGIPLIVAEFGELADDPGVMQNWGTILGALCYLGGTNVSWVARDYRGPRGLLSKSGAVQPWTPMVVAQARNPC